MAIIADFLEKIKLARYGKDVRDSIHDAIAAINTESEAAVKSADSASDNAAKTLQSAQNAERNAAKAADEVAGVKTDIYDNLMPEMRRIKDDTAVLKDDTENIKNDTSDIRDDAELVKNATVEIKKQCEALAEKCENATAGIDGGLIPCGTKNFDELPELSEVKQGWMYNVADDFMTTEDFICGADFYYPAGTNIYAIIHEDGLKWDCLGGEMSGYVMKKDFSEMTANSAPEFEEAESLGLTSGISTIKTLFGNVKKLIKILGSTDISTLGDGTVTGALGNINSVKASQTDVDSLKSGLANLEEDVSILNSDKVYKSLKSDKLYTELKQAELADSINNYRELVFWLRNTSGRIYASHVITTTMFKTFTSDGRSIGLETYLDTRIYTSIWYNSDTSISYYSSGDKDSMYWQMFGVK